MQETKKKERHIVTWTQQEDDILREQISIHGTENWSIIASKFKDKTTRQCRRRWYTYLNSDFKNGGWSPEEDMLLCEAQKIFGNRWTEIAKVVSGRTDNAVKNRFSTLCKKRARYEALAKENNNAYINPNDRRILFQNGFSTNGTPENAAPAKRVRWRSNVKIQLPSRIVSHKLILVDSLSKTQFVFQFRRERVPDLTENCDFGNRSHRQSGTAVNQHLRPPLTVLPQNFPSVANVPYNLSLIVDTSRHPGLYEDSPASSEYSTGSTLIPHPAGDNTDQIQERTPKNFLVYLLGCGVETPLNSLTQENIVGEEG